jgi:hypothetical protein
MAEQAVAIYQGKETAMSDDSVGRFKKSHVQEALEQVTETLEFVGRLRDQYGQHTLVPIWLGDAGGMQTKPYYIRRSALLELVEQQRQAAVERAVRLLKEE